MKILCTPSIAKVSTKKIQIKTQIDKTHFSFKVFKKCFKKIFFFCKNKNIICNLAH